MEYKEDYQAQLNKVHEPNLYHKYEYWDDSQLKQEVYVMINYGHKIGFKV